MTYLAYAAGGSASVTSSDCARHPKPRQVWPVRIAGTFGAGQPHSDLFLSPDDAVYVKGVLIPIRHLINGSTIAQVPVDHVTYCHWNCRGTTCCSRRAWQPSVFST